MLRQQFGSHAQIEVLPELKQSVKERLAAVDRLLADGKISPEEHAQQAAAGLAHRTHIRYP